MITERGGIFPFPHSCVEQFKKGNGYAFICIKYHAGVPVTIGIGQ